VHDPAAVARGGDIEKDEFVGALGIVGFSALDGVARVAELLKLNALNDAAGVDVQTRNDAAREHAKK
jgi:hypothetical protein